MVVEVQYSHVPMAGVSLDGVRIAIREVQGLRDTSVAETMRDSEAGPATSWACKTVYDCDYAKRNRRRFGRRTGVGLREAQKVLGVEHLGSWYSHCKHDSGASILALYPTTEFRDRQTTHADQRNDRKTSVRPFGNDPGAANYNSG